MDRMERGPDMAEVWVVIAAHNEARAIRAVVAGLEPLGCEIVVVDDGSEDGTAEALEGGRCHRLAHAANLGQGAALRTGIEYALGLGARIVVTFDADGQHRPQDVPRLVEPVAAGRCDVALGTRFAPGGGAENIPAAKLWTLRLAVLFTRLSTGLAVTDAHNGLRAIGAEAARKIRVTQNRMAHASQILSEIRRLRLKFEEVPVTIAYTEYSIGKGQKIANAYNILWDSIMEVFRR